VALVVPVGMQAPYLRPSRILPEHRLDGFDSGKPALDAWLRAKALDNEGKASRTYVVSTDAGVVAAYYTLATGHVVRTDVPGKHRHGLPNPVPVMVLGRLAVDRAHAGRRLGEAMLKEAMTRTLEAAEIAGIRALIVHAIDEAAAGFYIRYGFQLFPPGSLTLFLPIETIAKAAAG